MSITIGRWGIGLESSHLIIWLYLGDIYLKIPLLGELAINSIGIFFDRYEFKNKSTGRDTE